MTENDARVTEAQPRRWPNGCNRTVPEALRFLARHERPTGGEQRFNMIHLLQLAEEIEEAARQDRAAAFEAWPNGCDRTVPEALRYLAKHDRPTGREQRFNAIHLWQLAGEIEKAAPPARDPAPEVAAPRPASKRLDIMEGDLETGLYLEQSGYRKPIDIASALQRQASQENCDGDPYESMVFAARYIKHLRAQLAAVLAERDAGRTELAIQRSLTETARQQVSELGTRLQELTEEIARTGTLERGIKARAFENLARCIRDPGQSRKQGLTDLEGVLKWHERHLEQVAEATTQQPEPRKGWLVVDQDRLWQMIESDGDNQEVEAGTCLLQRIVKTEEDHDPSP